MSVKERRDLLNTFEPVAIRLADLSRNYHLGLIQHGVGIYSNDSNLWNGWAYMDFFSVDPWKPNPFHRPPHFDTLPDNTEGIKYWFNPYCWVAFGGFRPKENTDYKTTIGEPQLLHEAIVSQGRKNFSNRTEYDSTEKWSVLAKDETTTTIADHIAVKASASFRALLGYDPGDAGGVKAETEITTSVEAENSKDTSYSHTTGIEETIEWEGINHAGMVLFLDHVRTVSHYKQIYTIDGYIDFDTWIYSEGDFTLCWEGTDMMRECLSGVGPAKGPYENWSDIINRHPIFSVCDTAGGWRQDMIGMLSQLCDNPKMTVEVPHEFDRAYNDKIDYHEEPIN